MVDETKIVFDCPLPPWGVGVAATVILVVVALFVRRDVAHLGRRLRLLLPALVVLGLLMLVGLVLSPKLIRTWPDPQKPRCALLVDGSRSMLLADRYEGEAVTWLANRPNRAGTESDTNPTREEVVRSLLSVEPEGWVAAVGEKFDVVASRFASAVEGLSVSQGAPPGQVDSEGYATALGEALEEAGRGAGGARSRAVILISDGAWNTGRDPSEVARTLGGLGTPVFVVGVGNPDPPRDVAVLALRGPKSALPGDEVFLTAQIATTGMGAVRVPVELVGDGQVLETKHIVTLPSGQPVNVNFSFVPDAPGRRVFTARVAHQEGEKDDANNAAAVTIEIVERKIRVLLVEGEPRWEFRFLRNVLERDPAVEATVCLLRPGVGPIAGEGYLDRPPGEKKDLLAYDLVILGDVPPSAVPPAFLEELAGMVRRGVGSLIVVAGRRRHFQELAGTPLEPVLPVTLENALGVDVGGAGPFSVELTQDGASHLITCLNVLPEENQAIWSHLPPLEWSAGVGGLARGATALLVHPYRLAGPSKMPLLAVHRVGGGKVMFCGMEDTWRWRRGLGDKYHYRFWAQAVRWMVKKPFAEGDPRARLSADRTECNVGEAIQVEAYCLGPDGFPLERAQVWLQVTGPGGSRRRLAMAPVAGGWGIYRASLTPSAAGAYEMRPIVSVYGDEPLSSSVSLEVARLDLEKHSLAQNLNLLRAIAEASGGEYLAVNEADRLPSLLAAKVENRPLTAEYSPCRHWVYYTVLTLLLGTAWLVRKRSGLA